MPGVSLFEGGVFHEPQVPGSYLGQPGFNGLYELGIVFLLNKPALKALFAAPVVAKCPAKKSGDGLKRGIVQNYDEIVAAKKNLAALFIIERRAAKKFALVKVGGDVDRNRAEASLDRARNRLRIAMGQIGAGR